MASDRLPSVEFVDLGPGGCSMIGFTPFRSLHSVMIVTLHVAVISYVLRAFMKSTDQVGSFVVLVPLSILLALFFSVPIGRAVSEAFQPGDGVFDRRCPRCGRADLRPLLRPGRGIFQPITGYRCAGCRTTYRPVGDAIVEEPAPSGEDSRGEGIQFLPSTLDAPAVESEIRFLGDRDGRSNDPKGVANISEGPVSDSNEA